MPATPDAKPAAKKAAAAQPEPEVLETPPPTEAHPIKVRMQDAYLEANIYERLSAVAQDVGAISKDRKNEHQKYNFRGIDDLMNALHPIMAKAGVTLAPHYAILDRYERPTKNGGLNETVVLEGRYTFHGIAGDSVEVVTIGQASDTADKAANKAMSAALKYALMQVFTVPTQDMDDADRVTVEQAPMPTVPQLLERLDKCCTKMGMPREDITAKYRERHGGISLEAFEALSAEQMMPFVLATEAHVEQEMAR